MKLKYLLNLSGSLLKSYKVELEGVKNENCPGARVKNIFFYESLVTQANIHWIVDALKKMHYDTAGLEKELAKLDLKFNETYRTDKCRAQLFEELKNLIDEFNPEDIFLDGYEFENVINRRTDIQVLSEGLAQYFDLSEYTDRLKVLDEKLKACIIESIVKKTYSPDDLPFAPVNYWWLHLEEKYGKFKDVHGIPEYEDVDPEPVLKDCEKLLSLSWLHPDIRSRIEKVYRDAKEASDKGTKVRLYTDYLSIDFFKFTPILTSGNF